MKRVALFSAAGLVAAILVIVSLLPDRRVRVGPDWKPSTFHAALRERWEAKYYTEDVLLLRRPGTLTWDELYDMAQAFPRKFSAAPGRLLVTKESVSAALELVESDVLNLHPLTVRGHPDELQKLTDRFTR